MLERHCRCVGRLPRNSIWIPGTAIRSEPTQASLNCSLSFNRGINGLWFWVTIFSYMSLVVVGSVAYDGVETPHGKVDRMLGGAATYISLAAGYFTSVGI